ncbi:hypothetical protein [Chryseobacterium gregarium]|uniref:hypothetical protein n=1 Tax=Chryseobacterium gregarium TaxID=456299 RepID=UPI00041BCD46|nr:hypothetical protein [Chryseobacterium gregarium]
MGIIALVLILVIILIFFLSRIPNLTITRKIVIVVSVLLLCIVGVAIIFITGFESGRMPRELEVENNQKISNHNQINSEKKNNQISAQNNLSQDSLNEVMLETTSCLTENLQDFLQSKNLKKLSEKLTALNYCQKKNHARISLTQKPQPTALMTISISTKMVRDLKISKIKLLWTNFDFLKTISSSSKAKN